MVESFRPARTEAYEHTISGLLTKRREMLTEAERIRDRLAEFDRLRRRKKPLTRPGTAAFVS